MGKGGLGLYQGPMESDFDAQGLGVGLDDSEPIPSLQEAVSGLQEALAKAPERREMDHAHGVAKGTWLPEEDRILMAYVAHHGPKNWNSLQARALLKRSGKSCRLRWVNQLKPGLMRNIHGKGCKRFTEAEERLVIQLQRAMGNRWAQISKFLPGRTDNDVKNFWNLHMKRLERARGAHQPADLGKKTRGGGKDEPLEDSEDGEGKPAQPEGNGTGASASPASSEGATGSGEEGSGPSVPGVLTPKKEAVSKEGVSDDALTSSGQPPQETPSRAVAACEHAQSGPTVETAGGPLWPRLPQPIGDEGFLGISSAVATNASNLTSLSIDGAKPQPQFQSQAQALPSPLPPSDECDVNDWLNTVTPKTSQPRPPWQAPLSPMSISPGPRGPASWGPLSPNHSRLPPRQLFPRSCPEASPLSPSRLSPRFARSPSTSSSNLHAISFAESSFDCFGSTPHALGSTSSGSGGNGRPFSPPMHQRLRTVSGAGPTRKDADPMSGGHGETLTSTDAIGPAVPSAGAPTVKIERREFGSPEGSPPLETWPGGATAGSPGLAGGGPRSSPGSPSPTKGLSRKPSFSRSAPSPLKVPRPRGGAVTWTNPQPPVGARPPAQSDLRMGTDPMAISTPLRHLANDDSLLAALPTPTCDWSPLGVLASPGPKSPRVCDEGFLFAGGKGLDHSRDAERLQSQALGQALEPIRAQSPPQRSWCTDNARGGGDHEGPRADQPEAGSIDGPFGSGPVSANQLVPAGMQAQAAVGVQKPVLTRISSISSQGSSPGQGSGPGGVFRPTELQRQPGATPPRRMDVPPPPQGQATHQGVPAVLENSWQVEELLHCLLHAPDSLGAGAGRQAKAVPASSAWECQLAPGSGSGSSQQQVHSMAGSSWGVNGVIPLAAKPWEGEASFHVPNASQGHSFAIGGDADGMTAASDHQFHNQNWNRNQRQNRNVINTLPQQQQQQQPQALPSPKQSSERSLREKRHSPRAHKQARQLSRFSQQPFLAGSWGTPTGRRLPRASSSRARSVAPIEYHWGKGLAQL